MLGGGYALVAIGYTLIFGVLNLLHLAHGEVAMIGSYVGLTLVLIATSLVLMVGLYFFVEKTTMGRAMRACAENTQTARLLGVNVHWITIWTFGIASALAGAAGVLIGLAYNITPLMGGALGLKGLTIMLFGGSGNIVGAMVAALILGMIETMSVAYLVPAWKDGFAFGILILILLYKPSGLLGSRLQIEAGR